MRKQSFDSNSNGTASQTGQLELAWAKTANNFWS